MPNYNQSSQPLFTSAPLFGKVGTFFLIIFVVLFFIIAQAATFFIAAFGYMPAQMLADINTAMQELAQNGAVLSISLCLTFIVINCVLVAIIKLRKRSVSHYLPMTGFKFNLALKFFTLCIIFILVTEVFTQLANRNSMAFMDDIYKTANPLWLLALTIIVFVPIYEELIFRGLLWQATAQQFVDKKTGAIFATVLMALIFAALHVQYDFFDIFSIFLLALILGYARYRSASVLLPILMHMFNNGVVFLQYTVMVSGSG